MMVTFADLGLDLPLGSLPNGSGRREELHGHGRAQIRVGNVRGGR